MCISVSKVPKTLENKGFFLDTDKKIMCIYVYHLYQMCISSGSASFSLSVVVEKPLYSKYTVHG